jgi:hypothetical protein
MRTILGFKRTEEKNLFKKYNLDIPPYIASDQIRQFKNDVYEYIWRVELVDAYCKYCLECKFIHAFSGNNIIRDVLCIPFIPFALPTMTILKNVDIYNRNKFTQKDVSSWYKCHLSENEQLMKMKHKYIFTHDS